MNAIVQFFDSIRSIATVNKLDGPKKGSYICRKTSFINPSCISIGRDCYIGPNCRLEAWTNYDEQTFEPRIVLGDEVKINSTCHIGAIDSISIGNQCLLGSHVFITDHSHGNGSLAQASIHPTERPLFSKGPVVIGERCWLGENVVVLPGVTIGDECIVGANAVVTKSMPPRSVIAGCPARVVKTIE